MVFVLNNYQKYNFKLIHEKKLYFITFLSLLSHEKRDFLKMY